jgi:hypothetical protein
MDASKISNIVTEVQATGDVILETIGAAAPGATGAVVLSEALLNLFAEMAVKALNAWSQASGIPITEASVAALLPNSTPLSAPDPA